MLPRIVKSLFFMLFVFPAVASAGVKVGVSDWPGWVAWYVAEEKGFFEQHGAEVELIWFPNYTDSIQALSAGQLDANSQTWSDTMAPLAAGIPLKLILVNDNSAGNDAVMVRPEIETFEDLAGRTVALEEYSISHFVLATALARNGMSLDEVRVVNLSAGDAAAAFLSGRVDAAVVWNPWVNRIEESGKGHALFTSADMPGLIPDALVAQEDALEADRDAFLAMIRAWYDAQAFITEHPEQAAGIMAEVVGLEPADYAVYLPGTRFFDQQANLEAFGPAGDPRSLIAVAPTIADFLAEHGLLEGEVPFADGLDGSLVREVAGQ